MTDREPLSAPRPLNLRLRDEASEWDEGETIPPLLLEAAEAIEHLAVVAAIASRCPSRGSGD